MTRDRSNDIEVLDMPWPIAVLAVGSPLLLAAVIWICSQIYQPALVVDPIMYPALQVNQVVVVDTRPYGPRRTPKYGDVLAYNPPTAPGLTFFGRVAALEGDRIRVSHSVVIVNDKPLLRARAAVTFTEWGNEKMMVFTETAPNGTAYHVLTSGSVDGDMEELRVPAGAVFVLGDTRDGALDSRSALGGFGPIGYEIIRGRVM
ncbi:MAG: signal peptidase I [Hyphomonadaceae bacterium]|nr:signal peptidase I [Hyphomonadaceae bacterium]